MPVAYSYIRFSSLRQKQGASEARQGERPEPWCQEHGYTLDTSLKPDRGKSGFHGDHIKHGALGVFLTLVKEGQIQPGSVLLIEHLDRFTRQDPFTGMEHLSAIISAGIDIVTLMDGERYSRDRLTKDFAVQMRLMFTLFQSHQESDKKSDRLKDVWKRKRALVQEGKKVSRRTPAWLDADGKVIDANADVIRRVFAMAAAGSGPTKIASVFNQEKLPPIGKAKQWAAMIVRTYLRSRSVMGEYQSYREVEGKDVPQGDPVAGYYPAIVDRETFFAVQRSLNDRKRVNMAGRTTESKNLFTRLIFNLYDGGRYHFREDRDKRWGPDYSRRKLIPGKHKDGMPGSMSVAIEYDHFERHFLQWVREVDVVSLFAPVDSSAKGKELASLQTDAMEIDNKIATMKVRVKKSKNIDTILSMIQEMEGDRKSLTAKIEILKSELVTSQARIFEDLRGMLDDPGARAKIAAFIRLLVDRIDLLPLEVSVGRWQKVDYLLYTEVTFHNGQARMFVTDSRVDRHDGFTIAATGPAYDRETILEVRRETIDAMIALASDRWRPLLQARFPYPKNPTFLVPPIQ